MITQIFKEALCSSLEEREYIIVSRKFDNVSAAACPLVGQLATNSKGFAYLLYNILKTFSYDNYGSIAVMLMKRNENGTYDAIER